MVSCHVTSSYSHKAFWELGVSSIFVSREGLLGVNRGTSNQMGVLGGMLGAMSTSFSHMKRNKTLSLHCTRTQTHSRWVGLGHVISKRELFALSIPTCLYLNSLFVI